MKDIENAVSILEANITSIRTVKEWAEVMGYKNANKFSWEFRKCFGYRPHKALYAMRVEKILEYIAEDPEESNYSIALEFGFANDKRFTELRKGRTKRANEKGERKGRTKRANEKGERK